MRYLQYTNFENAIAIMPPIFRRELLDFPRHCHRSQNDARQRSKSLRACVQF